MPIHPELIDNSTARRLFLAHHRLSDPAGAQTGRAGLADLVADLGFVQVDSIRTIERAHHHILFSRSHQYQHRWLTHHLERKRSLFENWTHDAAVIPSKWFGYWHPMFRRYRAWILANKWWRQRLGDDFLSTVRDIKEQISENGPVMARDIGGDEPPATPGSTWWGWRPSKSALEFMWRTGELAVTGRRGFQKVYDLTERVIPTEYYHHQPSEAGFIDWACRTAIQRLGFATATEIARFWDAISIAEATTWCQSTGRDRLRTVKVELAAGSWREMYARDDIFCQHNIIPEPPARLRLLSPFDPILRDRSRAAQLFGFTYKFEAFVPAAQRRFGYYVLPVLEGDRLIGRIDVKAQRPKRHLTINGAWLEPRLQWTAPRQRRLTRELQRWSAFLDLKTCDPLPR